MINYFGDLLKGALGQGVGLALGELFNRPRRERLEQRLPTTSIAGAVPQQSPEQAWQGATDFFTGKDYGKDTFSYSTGNGQFMSQAQYHDVERSLQQYVNPQTGQIDWTRAQAAGALQPLGISAEDVAPGQIMQQGMADREAGLGLVNDRIGEVTGGYDQIRSEMGASRDAANASYGQVRDDVAATRAKAEAIPGELSAMQEMDRIAFEEFQAQQMVDMQSMISAGLDRLDSEKAEALTNISSNLARDMEATTAANRSNYRSTLAQIEGDPNLSPEAKMQLKSQVGMQTAITASREAAPIRRMYQELETNTRTSFAKFGADFSATGVATIGQLSTAQQASRGEMYTEQSRQYGAALEVAGKMDVELDNILSTAMTSNNLLGAEYDKLALTAETTKDELLNALLGSKLEFTMMTPLLEEMYGMNVNLASLTRAEEESNFGNFATIEGFDAAASQQFAGGLMDFAAGQEAADAQRDAGRDAARGSIIGSSISAAGSVAGGALGAGGKK